MDEARIEEEVVADMTILDSSSSDVVGPKKLCQYFLTIFLVFQGEVFSEPWLGSQLKSAS